jgi:hypothetical protein
MKQPPDSNARTPAAWFEMTDLRRRKYATAVWVPLRVSENTVFAGNTGRPGNKEEWLCVGCIGVPIANKAEAEKLQWMDIGLSNEGRPYAFQDGRYSRAEAYQHNDGEDFGVNFVHEQRISGSNQRFWHVNQDLLLALDLMQEGDAWVKPDEGYVEVLRQRRDADGKVVAIEIKNEFLRDYLAARGLALRLYCYRQRFEVMPDVAHIPWVEQPIREQKAHDRFETRTWAVGEDGDVHGASVGLFQMWRTDVDHDEDVPVFGPPTETNTGSRSVEYKRQGPKFHRVEGELWRGEWIEPALRSERVRRDKPEQPLSYIVDAGGKRETGDVLDDEDIGSYLWFSPQVVTALTSLRGGGLRWYTGQTGGVCCSPSYPLVHFGVNSIGLINAYAYDVACLPMWQQRLWVGHNVTPNGPPSTELLQAQMKVAPARTKAPEQRLSAALEALDDVILARTGIRLFKTHDSAASILRSVHRFRAVDEPGLLALAKDIARLVADRIEIGALRKLAIPPKGENWGSLKSLEKGLATVIAEPDARKIMSPLFGVYELRLADAHLPSSEFEVAFAKVGVDRSAMLVMQGEQLIAGAASALQAVHATFAKQEKSSHCPPRDTAGNKAT